MEDIFKEENIPASAWKKFEKVGDKVSGEVLEIFEKPEKDGFPAQRCFLLKQDDGSEINVGLKKTSDYLMGRTNQVKPGDKLGVLFKAEIPSKDKKKHNAKSLEIYIIKKTEEEIKL